MLFIYFSFCKSGCGWNLVSASAFFLFCNVTLVEKLEESLASPISSWKRRKREEQGGGVWSVF